MRSSTTQLYLTVTMGCVIDLLELGVMLYCECVYFAMCFSYKYSYYDLVDELP